MAVNLVEEFEKAKPVSLADEFEAATPMTMQEEFQAAEPIVEKKDVQSLEGTPVQKGMPTSVASLPIQGLNEVGQDVLFKPLVRAPIETARSAALGLAAISADDEKKEQLFSFVQATTEKIKALQPGDKTNFVDRFVGGIVGLAPYLAAGPYGAVALLANSASRGVDAINEGIDDKTALALSWKDLATTAAFFKLPMGGTTILEGASKGAAMNAGLDILSKGVEKGILTLADYQDVSAKISLIDPESIGQAAALGALFGAHTRPAKDAVLSPKEEKIVGSDEQRIILKDAIDKINMELNAAGLAPKEREAQLKLKLGKLGIDKTVPVQAALAEEDTAAITGRTAALKEENDLASQMALDFPETRGITTPPTPAAEAKPTPPLEPSYRPTAKALEVSRRLAEEQRIKEGLEKEQQGMLRELEIEHGAEYQAEIEALYNRGDKAEIEKFPMNIKEWYDKIKGPAIAEQLKNVSSPPLETLPSTKAAPSVPVAEGVAPSRPSSQIKREMEALQRKLQSEVERDPMSPMIDVYQAKEKALYQEMLSSDKTSLKKESESLDDLLKDFEVDDEVNSVLRGELDPTNGQTIFVPEKVVQLAQKAETAPKEYQDVRKGDAAYRIDSTGTILKGKLHSDLTGELLANPPIHDMSMGFTLGWIDPQSGEFIADWAPKKGPVNNVKVTEKETNSWMLGVISKLRDESGHWSNKPLPTQIPPEILSDVIRLRESFKALRRLARKADMTVDAYLRDKGLSEDSIKLYQQISLLDIKTSEVVPRATRDQKGYAHKLADELGVNHRDIAASLGIDKDKSMAKYSYDEAAKLVSQLERLKFKDTGDETIDNMLNRLENDEVGKYTDFIKSDPTLLQKFKEGGWDTLRRFLSPDIVLSKYGPKGQELYQVLDRANVKMLKHFSYLMGDHGMGLSAVEKTILKSSERIALAQENRISLDSLSSAERGALDKLKAAYKHMLDYQIDTWIPDANRQQLVREIAKKVAYTSGEKAEKIEIIINSYKDRYQLTGKESQALELLRMEKKYYLPHIFDKPVIIDIVKRKIQSLAKGNRTSELERYREILVKLEGGRLVTYNALPKEVMFAYYKERHGLEGYKVDAAVAFNVYVRGWLRKVYLEPAIKRAVDIYTEMPAEVKLYLKEYILDIGGKTGRSPIADAFKQFEWMRTLGFSVKSAITNLTQDLNTLVDVGPIAAYKGFIRAITPEGIKEFKASGLPLELPTIQYSGSTEGVVQSKLDMVRKASGVFFNAAEYGLRAHAYHASMAAAKAKGLRGDDAFWYAVDGMHKTQFRYGKIGMPTAMRGWGGVVTQFSSYTIKQGELLYKWAHEPNGIFKIGAYFAMAYGIKYSAQELLGFDLSNALGFGANFAEAYRMLEAINQSEWEDATKHWHLMWAGGSGILPSSFPLISGPGMKLIAAIGGSEEGKWWKVASELEPIQGVRMRDFINALKFESGGRYPVFKYDNPELFTGTPSELKYTLNLKDTIARCFGPKPSAESIYQLQEYQASLTDKEIYSIMNTFNRAVARGDAKEMERILGRYPGVIAGSNIGKSVKTQVLNMNLTDEERRLLKQKQPLYNRRHILLGND